MARSILIAGASVTRADDFQFSGRYVVSLGGEVLGVIYRDPENREWYEDCHKHYSQSWLGSSKKEAVERLVGRSK
jgi:hypothetical protein